MHRHRTLALVEVTLAVIFWGASFIATKIALRDISPLTIIWLRFGIGVVVLGAAMLGRGQFALLRREELAYFALLGFLGITLHQLLQSNALQTSQATTTAWIVSTTPVFIAILSFFFLKERLGGPRMAGIALAALGVLLVVSKGDVSSIAIGQFGAPGDLLVLISAVNWAVFSVLSRRGLRLYPATRMMFYVMGIGWLLNSLLFFTRSSLDDIARLTAPGWLGIGFLGVFCSGLAYIFWYDALQVLTASQTGAFLYIEPFVTAIIAALILGENLLLGTLTGGVLILLGVWLVNRPEGKLNSYGAADQPDLQVRSDHTANSE